MSRLLRVLVLTACLGCTAGMGAPRLPLTLSRPQRKDAEQRAAGTMPKPAMVIPGDTAAEYVVVDGLSNFLAIYNALISVRVLLSWFPQAMGIAALRPVFQLTDPYLNLFRGLIPPIAGLDLSILPAFFLLNFAQSSAPALGARAPAGLKERFASTRAQLAARASWVKGPAVTAKES
jgi:YggT family protein